MRLTTAACALGLAVLSAAAWADEFADGAAKPTADEIRQYVEGKAFNIKLASGDSWKLEYKGDGDLNWKTSKGYSGTSRWTHADGTLCDQPRGKVKSCNDVRMVGGVLHLKRESGEIIQYTP